MYRIKLADEDELVKKHLEDDGFITEVQKLMKSYLTKDAWDYTYKKGKSIKLKVETHSDTYRFLEKYSEEENLKKLLAGDFNVQHQIIKDVFAGIPDGSHKTNTETKRFEPINNRKSDIPKDAHIEVDDFNSILRSLFEDQLFDGKASGEVHINKEKVVARLGLRVCPYCGRTYIYSVSPERGGKRVKVKPQIDHFLPKSKFPFLAVNLYNLIPSCTPCNMEPAKGDKSPLVEFGKKDLKIMHPFLFEDNRITFLYDARSEAPYDASEMDIKVNYHGNDVLKNGYNDFFFIDELYKYHNVEAHDLYYRMKTWKSEAQKAYKALGLPDDYWAMQPELFFGFPLNESQAPLRPLFKFYKDIYKQLSNDFRTGKIK